MSRAGLVGPVVLDRDKAALASRVIEDCTGGVVLDGTPFAGVLPAFADKLRKALARRRAQSGEVRLWTVTRDEAAAGFEYLYLFSHDDLPKVLSSAELDAVYEVALDLAMAVYAERGRPTREADDLAERVTIPGSWRAMTRWSWRRKARSKVQTAEAVAFSQAAELYRRPPIPPAIWALLTPRKTTGI